MECTLRAASVACSLGLDAQNSSEGSKSEKKKFRNAETVPGGISETLLWIFRQEFKMWWQEYKDLSAICDSGFGEHCCSKDKMIALKAN